MMSGELRRERPPARWNLVAVFTPIFGVLCGFAAGLLIPQWLGEHPMEGPVWGMRVWFGFCAIGLLAAVIASIRAERLWPITVIGYLLNLPLLGLTSMYIGGR
jgi:hypothetical protein